MTKAPNVVPFGKYRGQPVESMAADRAYCDWLMAQGWFRERYANVYTLIVNNFGEPTETPEHNALQARFLDEVFCRGLLSALRWSPLVDATEFARRALRCRVEDKIKTISGRISRLAEVIEQGRKWESEGWPKPALYYTEELIWGDASKLSARLRRYEAELDEKKRELAEIEAQIDRASASDLRIDVKADFEVGGWDVYIRALAGAAALPLGHGLCDEKSVYVEIKPSLGDDYPAVLRQMKANRGSGDCRVLAFDQFAAVGATLAQVKAIFAASGITVLSFEDISADASGDCTARDKGAPDQ